MSEIRRVDVIEEAAIKAPLDLAANLGVAADAMKAFMTISRETDKVLSSATSAVKIKKNIDALTESEKQLIQVQGQISKSLAQNNEEYIAHKKGLDAVNKAVKDKINLGTRDAKTVNAQNASIKLLGAALEKNRRTYSEMATEQDRNSKAGKELLSVIEVQDKEFKQLNETMGKFQPSVGNYAKFTQSASAVTQQFVPQLHAMANGLIAGTKAALAFLAAPLGLVLAGIGLALAPLISYLKNTGDGMDLVDEKTEGLKNGFHTLLDAINEWGAGTAESGNKFTGFLKTLTLSNPIILAVVANIALLKKAFPGLTTEYDKAVLAGEAYARNMDMITTAMAFFEVSAAREENAIKRLILQSKNRTATEEERIGLIDKALAREKKLSDDRIGFATAEAVAIVNYAKGRTKEVKKADDTLETFGLRIAKALDKTDTTLRDKVLKTLTDLQKVEGESIAIEEKLQNQRDALEDKKDEKDEKRAQERLKRAQALAELTFSLEEIAFNRALAANKDNLERQADLRVDFEETRYEKAKADAARTIQDAEVLAKQLEVLEAQHVDNLNAITTGYQTSKLEQQKAFIEKSIESRQLELDKEIAAIQQGAIEAGTKSEQVEKQIAEAKKRNAEETIRLTIEQMEKILALDQLTAEERAKVETELAKLKINLTNTVYTNLTDKEKESIENTRKALSTIQAIYQDFASSISNLLGSFTDRRLQDLDIEARKLEDQKAIDLAGAGENAEAKKRIEEKYQKDLAQIERKKIQAQQRQARFDKITGLLNVGVNTAVNITKVFPNPVLMALAATLGAIQAAAIIAKPLPKYATGTGFHKGGAAIVGERGSELITIGRKHFLSPSSATLIPDLPVGASVLPHEPTMRKLATEGMRVDTLGTRRDAMLSGEVIKKLDQINQSVSASKTSASHYYQVAGVVYLAEQENDNFIKHSRQMSLGKWVK